MKIFGEKIKLNNKIVLAAAVAAVIILGFLAIPKKPDSVDSLCAQGNYAKAFEKADESQKNGIAFENLVAVQSAYIVSSLEKPKSFELKDAFYADVASGDGYSMEKLVLLVNSANDNRDIETKYWVFVYELDNPEWRLFRAVSGLEHEEPQESEDEEYFYDLELENIRRDFARDLVREAMDDGIRLSKESIERINTLNKKGILDRVELLDL